jgi:hypothetical protein
VGVVPELRDQKDIFPLHARLLHSSADCWLCAIDTSLDIVRVPWTR